MYGYLVCMSLSMQLSVHKLSDMQPNASVILIPQTKGLLFTRGSSVYPWSCIREEGINVDAPTLSAQGHAVNYDKAQLLEGYFKTRQSLYGSSFEISRFVVFYPILEHRQNLAFCLSFINKPICHIHMHAHKLLVFIYSPIAIRKTLTILTHHKY